MKPYLLPLSDSQAEHKTIDRMPDFWNFFEQTNTLSLEEKVQVFKKRIVEPNLSCYSCVFGINDDGLGKYIRETETKIDAMRANMDKVFERHQEIMKAFQMQFPDFRTDFVTYLLPSLDLFKGMAVPSQEKIILFLGMDALSELPNHHLAGYLVHELFHVYHFQRVLAVRLAAEMALTEMKMPPLWGLLWTEGLACYAVRLLYPEIPEEEVLDWRPLVDQTKPFLSELATEARRVLKSDSLQDIAGFFYFPRETGRSIPTGCGYYIGMLIAGFLAKRHPLDVLIGMNDETLICEIDTALIEMQENFKT